MIDIAKDEELLDIIAESGCYVLSFGLESISKESLKTKVELTNNTLNISIENDDSYDALFIPINYLDNYIFEVVI